MGVAPKTYYRGLDGLRAVAILLVLFEHWVYYGPLKIIAPGGLGVNIFFVLSGFLITEILLKRRGEPANRVFREFWWRRAVRIFPVFYVYLALLWWLNVPGTRPLTPWSALYAHNIYTALTGQIGPRVLSHIWSLCVEEQFYLLWPFLILLTPERWLARVLFAAPVVGLAARAFLIWTAPVPWAGEIAYRSMPTAIDALGIGAALALVKTRIPGRWTSLAEHGLLLRAFLCIAVVAEVMLAKAPPRWAEVAERSVSSAIAALLILLLIGSRQNSRIAALLESRPLVYIGRVSYGIYVYHLLMEYLLAPLLTSWMKGHGYFGIRLLQYNLYLVEAPLLFAATVAIASLSFYGFERPLLKLKNLVGNKPIMLRTGAEEAV
jgi:peptidoglycan/LPS O-acetylase OafA/YrhL